MHPPGEESGKGREGGRQKEGAAAGWSCDGAGGGGAEGGRERVGR